MASDHWTVRKKVRISIVYEDQCFTLYIIIIIMTKLKCCSKKNKMHYWWLHDKNDDDNNNYGKSKGNSQL